MFSELVYSPLHQVVVCKWCQTCVIPGAASIKRHLRAQPHCLLGQVLKTHLASTQALSLKTVQELREQKPSGRVLQLDYLRVYDGFQCLLCSSFLTIHLPRMRRHMHLHSRKAKEHETTSLWQGCRLQSYFTAGSRVDYFVVTDDTKKGRVPDHGRVAVSSTKPEQELFVKLEKDNKDVKGDIEEQASVVHDFWDSKSESIPWLETTRFPSHMARLRDEEIQGSYKLPSKKELNWDAQGARDPDLIRVLVAAEGMLRDAYQLCSDSFSERKMTQQRANILYEFYAGASGRADGFRYFKTPSTLTK
jgi:hypothetical protein